LYLLLLKQDSIMRDRGISVVAAENLRGTPVFQDLTVDPPASEFEFKGMWKLYFLSLVGGALQECASSSGSARIVLDELERAGLLKGRRTLKSLLRSVREYVRYLRPRAIESEFSIDPNVGTLTGITPRIILDEPSTAQARQGFVSVDELFNTADEALDDLGIDVWILLDRLDVAFAETKELEEVALRALFKTYLDLIRLQNLDLKIFIRSDIWARLTRAGFREASHITRSITISWNRSSLLNLVARRVLQNTLVCEIYSVDPSKILESFEAQSEFFYHIFPEQIDVGPNKPDTFGWMIGRTKDGTGDTAPRELIHLLNVAREKEIARLERGEVGSEFTSEPLFTRPSIKAALPEVSLVRLERTLYAEYPSMRDWLEKLEREKTLQMPSTLAKIWGLTEGETIEVADKLVEIGFFERRGSKGSPEYWVPFLYRDALNMVQGTAE